MIVTVQETIDHSAEVTYAAIRSYLERRGWEAKHYENTMTNGKPNPFDSWTFPGDTVPEEWKRGADRKREMNIGERDFEDLGGPDCVARRIERIALLEGREPHEVLADITGGR